MFVVEIDVVVGIDGGSVVGVVKWGAHDDVLRFSPWVDACDRPRESPRNVLQERICFGRHAGVSSGLADFSARHSLRRRSVVSTINCAVARLGRVWPRRIWPGSKPGLWSRNSVPTLPSYQFAPNLSFRICNICRHPVTHPGPNSSFKPTPSARLN